MLQKLKALFYKDKVKPMNRRDPLPSWNNGTASGSKEAIIEFVGQVTNSKFSSYVKPEDRIATFDNDGTLWSERPRYFQEYFILPALVEWDQTNDPTVDPAKTPLTKKELLLKDAGFYIGRTTEDYIDAATQFVQDTNHPYEKFSGYKLINMTYKPLIELLDYLRANEFEVYICSGGGRDFVRSFAEGAYGIPPENVIGSSIVTSYDKTQGSGGDVVRSDITENDGDGQVDKGLGQYNDKEGKPVGIQRQIGKRPIIACGNSSGDLQMFDYTDQGKDKSLIVLINHDDGDREFKYNDGTEGENLSWDKAQNLEHWRVVSMKDDFTTIFG